VHAQPGDRISSSISMKFWTCSKNGKLCLNHATITLQLATIYTYSCNYTDTKPYHITPGVHAHKDRKMFNAMYNTVVMILICEVSLLDDHLLASVSNVCKSHNFYSHSIDH